LKFFEVKNMLKLLPLEEFCAGVFKKIECFSVNFGSTDGEATSGPSNTEWCVREPRCDTAPRPPNNDAVIYSTKH
jgi:hypothetical protein